jgi:putative hydrolase of the HAD superfamily
MSKVGTIFFDVGQTLLAPDLDVTLEPLHRRGVRPTREQLEGTEMRARRRMDDLRLNHLDSVDANYADVYFSDLLAQFALDDTPLKLDLIARGRNALNYTWLLPFVKETLSSLAGHFQMAVISNADGNIARLLHNVGLASYFASITDSAVFGREKPAPEIFRHALDSVGARAEESVYVGDVYSIDYVGATAVGMKAVLVDRIGTYEGLEVPRISQLDQLEPVLRTLAA